MCACPLKLSNYPFSYPSLLVTIELLFLTTIPYCFQRLANDHASDPDSHVSFNEFLVALLLKELRKALGSDILSYWIAP